MPFYLVESYMSKNPYVGAQGGHVICGERKLLKQLFIRCMKKGYKPHQFTEWLHRKYGELVIQRKTCLGHGISLPCVLCRKAIERAGIDWVAHDGIQWVHSKKSICLPVSIATNKQHRVLGFRRDNKTQS
jgi:mannitol/fructose-specific phosphotransferase system IIA component